ncbi:hypothetical protein [Ferrimonas marina]|uniref:Cytochrome oxidase Cu insertion factor, SCO1/SenC/PrrC family n=1 Tax=Ferrimonas marina TaxID=299255 RepID=A0A1M5XT64_9GAMM|nr:hypothetical protein [Ferrimonas marina]SHI02902.1 hypothetical protein SAMN02745129_3673 [Ferrimonas marina]
MPSTGTHQRTLIVLLLAFVMPVLVAYAVLKLGLYQGGSTNKGQLLSALSYEQLAHENPEAQQWQIIAFLPEQCDESCQDNLVLMRQTHQALGREQQRVRPLVFTQSDSDLSAVKQLSELQVTQATANDQVVDALAPYALVVVDPWGQWVLGYPHGSLTTAEHRRDLLADLRKLLKLSRIG